ncbi:uncharacterized protein LOC133343635 isoform X6 [Lethenteron reissneri]|uniref:uncharacterized protein LOC133343635 isoform X6 n=1 Tax=Lethenteron reissneri TaxID=7753 RepID=UPI002AB7EEF4|nr:uncharacterized protein LOC133343635 isoform X6 [Lethenteron reissneri]
MGSRLTQSSTNPTCNIDQRRGGEEPPVWPSEGARARLCTGQRVTMCSLRHSAHKLGASFFWVPATPPPPPDHSLQPQFGSTTQVTARPYSSRVFKSNLSEPTFMAGKPTNCYIRICSNAVLCSDLLSNHPVKQINFKLYRTKHVVPAIGSWHGGCSRCPCSIELPSRRPDDAGRDGPFRCDRVQGDWGAQVASPEEREDPAEGPTPPTPPCLHIESDSGCRKGPILPSPTADVEAKEEAGSVRPLPLHHLYDTPYEPPFARGLPQPESPSGNERVKAPPGDPARLAETAPPDPDCDPPASSSPTQALALLPSHPSTSRVPSALSSIPSEPPSQPPARDSRMPKDDDRPPEEYDQPWEWKRDCISQAFAADVSCTDELPWPPPVGQLDGEAGPSIVPGAGSMETSAAWKPSRSCSSTAHPASWCGPVRATPVNSLSRSGAPRGLCTCACRGTRAAMWCSEETLRPSPRSRRPSSFTADGVCQCGAPSSSPCGTPCHPPPPSLAMSLTQPAPRRPLSDDGLSLS